MRRQNAQVKALNITLGAVDTLLDFEKRKDKKRIIKETNFEQEKEDLFKPVRVGNFWSRKYTEYEANGKKTKHYHLKEYLNEITPYLKDIINDLRKFDAVKIQLIIIAINSTSCKETD